MRLLIDFVTEGIEGWNAGVAATRAILIAARSSGSTTRVVAGAPVTNSSISLPTWLVALACRWRRTFRKSSGLVKVPDQPFLGEDGIPLRIDHRRAVGVYVLNLDRLHPASNDRSGRRRWRTLT